MPIGGASNGRGGAISADRHHDVLQVPLEVQRQGARLHDLVDLLTILMAARDEETGESMSDAQLTMMIAGHETTANALSWLWVLLDRHPAEQERLREELTAATGGRCPTDLKPSAGSSVNYEPSRLAPTTHRGKVLPSQLVDPRGLRGPLSTRPISVYRTHHW
jgi:cytochrome P450